MNEPHDPNRTVDEPSAPADSLDAGLAAGFAAPHSGLGGVPPALLKEEGDGTLPAVPGYRVLREIDRGGMGRVLAAHDLTLDRDVALKVLLRGASSDLFVRESKITARLPHPGIPPVHALGTLSDGSPFLAMKLVAGRTLAEEMKSADRPRLLQAFAQVCQAAGFAHSKGGRRAGGLRGDEERPRQEGRGRSHRAAQQPARFPGPDLSRQFRQVQG
jgi:serine/threonine protein kinase